ncbi:MAG: sigma 54-interacting transcriptional regulator [Planctomycetota bacterium]
MLSVSDRRFVETLSELSFENPFQPKRLELERLALGREFEAEDYIAWSKDFSRQANERPNVRRLNERAAQIADQMRGQLHAGETADDTTLQLYQDLISYVLYYRFAIQFDVETLIAGGRRTRPTIAKVWKNFNEAFHHYLALPKCPLLRVIDPAHWFATFFQVRRAFLSIFDNILGESLPAVKLRAAVWQSVFTHDMRRYRRSLYAQMRELTTLITGPSGTGKELVARAISLSQYIEFDVDKQQFVGGLDDAFSPVNLSALSPTLIESELFGHCRGAFTGAVADRQGWLECCPAHGAVFLDEIGDLDMAVQVKLLRVVQNGGFSRIGEVRQRCFAGKLLAATHRNLTDEIQAGRFREDLYYRLCSDRISTPSLREQLEDRPEALRGLISFIAQGLVASEAETLTDEVETWINGHIGTDYPWPGNIRELEQCVRNVLVRSEYQPPQLDVNLNSSTPQWLREAEQGTLTHAELLSRYCTAVYAKLGSYQQTAEVLGIDRRTVRSKIDPELLATFNERTHALNPHLA